MLWFNSSGNEGDKRLVGWTKTVEKVGHKLLIKKWISSCSKCVNQQFHLAVILRDGLLSSRQIGELKFDMKFFGCGM